MYERLHGIRKKIKQRIDEMTSRFKNEIARRRDMNVCTYSRIIEIFREKSTWCDNEYRKLNEYVEKNMAGYLYIMRRNFERRVSEVKSRLKETEHKHTLKGFDFKENKVVLKCVFEDLDEVCELQEEVTGSDDGLANDDVASTTDFHKTRRELSALLNQAKQGVDNSEKTRKALCDELGQVKKDLDKSEKARKRFEQDLLEAKRVIERSEKTRKALCDELGQVKKDLDKSGKARTRFEQDLLEAKRVIEKSEKTRKALCDELGQAKKDLDKSEKARKRLKQELLEAKRAKVKSERINPQSLYKSF
ncbi:myosin heavy chain, muscle-like [Mya arenaria]|uniref:myosin heavy chain, muscle-like n=1 Tax=Mya arenaria TaxID=6604 RepID=UPI0022E7C302|nr:myosin heavy chain, muscle-like [Mya arenaria]